MNQTRKIYGNRFMMLSAPTTEGGQTSAIDLETGRGCIVAWAARGSQQAAALAQERAFFEALATHPNCPALLGWMDSPEATTTWLAIALCEGTPLPKAMTRDGPMRPLSGMLLSQWALSLVTWLQIVRQQSENVPQLLPQQLVVTADNTLTFQRLLPFPHPLSEAQSVGIVGQLLYYFATTYRYSSQHPWSQRAISATNYTVAPAFADYLHRLIETERPAATLATLRHSLETFALAPRTPTLFLPPLAEPPTEAGLRQAAQAAGEQLAATIANGSNDLTLYRGLAGGVLVLAELFSSLKVASWRKPLADAATRLTDPLPPQPKAGSLYLGEAGIAFALMKAGDALEDDRLVAAGVALGEHISTLPHHTPDLLWGTAGRLRFHLWFWERTNNPHHLDAAHHAATWLLAHRVTVADHAGYFWQDSTTPESSPYLGYGHGIAGIGDALLDLYAITRDPALLATIETIAETLHATAIPTLDGQGVNWHNYLQNGVLLDQWCHGATGIGIFWCHLAQLTGSATALEMARRTAHTVAYGSAYLSPCVCHGLAGSIELLLDVHQATGDADPLAQAWRFYHLMDDFRVEGAWLNHYLQANDPALMIGYGGVALSLLRLLDPARPGVLSQNGCWYRSRPLETATALPLLTL